MPKTNRDLVLFNKEYGRYPYKYRLYFVKRASMGTDHPVIYRYCTHSRNQFNKFSLGVSYDIVFTGVFVKGFEPMSTVGLSDCTYMRLIDARDLMFMDAPAAKRLDLLSNDYSPEDYYYSYPSYKALVEYTPGVWHKLLVGAIKILSYLLSIAVPVAIYLLFIFAMSSGMLNRADISTSKVFALPVASIGTLPFLLWMMTMIFYLLELLCLNMDFMRYDMLRLYALRWGGIRKSCYFEPLQKQRFLRTGIISVSILVVSVIAVFFIL